MRAFLFLTVLICAGCKPSVPVANNPPQEKKVRPHKPKIQKREPQIYFTAVHFAEGEKNPRQLIIRGTLGGEGGLELNPNSITLDSKGKINGSTTFLSWSPVPVQIKLADTPDPGQKGRKVYNLVSDDDGQKRSFSLLIAANEAGPHELLVREGNKVVGTYPLVDPDREEHLAMAKELAKASAEEQQAITELRKIMGYTFKFKMDHRNSVSMLFFPNANRVDFDELDSAMQGLKNLNNLHIYGGIFPAEGMSSLRKMSSLQDLTFGNCDMTDSDLSCLQDATQMISLTFDSCPGVTDETLENFKGMKYLKRFNVQNVNFTETLPKTGRITDAGLQHLAGCTRLEYLNLMGHRITDNGLKHLSGMTSLKSLSLTFSDITDEGMKHLERLPSLSYVVLSGTRVTPKGQASLKAKVDIQN